MAFVGMDGYILNIDLIYSITPVEEREVEGQKEFYFRIGTINKTLTISNEVEEKVTKYYNWISNFVLNYGMKNNDINSNN